MGKALVSNITVSLGLVIVRKALAMARLSVVATLLAMLPLSSSQFCPLARLLLLSTPWLAPYCPSSAGTLRLHSGWHPTANRRPASPLPGGSARLLPSWSVDPPSVKPSRGIALPPWLCPTPWVDVMTCPTIQHGFGGPSTSEFSYVADRQPSPAASVSGRQRLFFSLGAPAEGFGSLYQYLAM